MAPEDKPNVALDIFCFLLPVTVTIFLPGGVWLLAFILLSPFISDPTGHLFVKTLPAAYIAAVAIEAGMALLFVRHASSPRSKSAAQHLLRGVCFVIACLALGLIYLLLDYAFHR